MSARTIPILALSVAEAAHSTGYSESVIRAAIRRGDLYAVKVGEKGEGEMRIGVDELKRLFARKEEAK